jgi:hypothetical protein
LAAGLRQESAPKTNPSATPASSSVAARFWVRGLFSVQLFHLKRRIE